MSSLCGRCRAGTLTGFIACAQVIVESRAECEEAQALIGHIRAAYPEVLTAIKTKQLAQEMLLYKEDHIGDVARTGATAAFACPLAGSVMCSACSADASAHWVS